MNSTKLLRLAAGLAAGALSSAGTARADFASTVLAQNPVGYWRFNDAVTLPSPLIATNLSTLGAVANGYAVGDPTLSSVTTYPFPVSGEPGIVGNCFRFSNNPLNTGNSISKVDVPFLDALNPQGSFSAELWVKVAQTPTDLYSAISSMNADSGGRFGWLLYADGLSPASTAWNFRMGSSSGSGYAVSLTTANGVITTNVWQHVAVVYDATAQMAYIYVNGAVASSGPTSGFGANTSAELHHTGRAFRLGGSGLNGTYGTIAGNRGFDGWIDEVAVYGSVLSPSTIAAHYAAATTNAAGYDAQILASNPLGYWNLDNPVYTAPDPSTYPTALNLGTLGAAANGTYTPGAAFSSSPPPFAGGGNTAIALNGAMGSVQISSNLDIVGPITVMAWVKPTLNDNLRDIVAHGYGTSEDFLRIVCAQNIGAPTASSTPYYEFGSWDGSANYSVTYSMPPGDLGRWVFLAGTYDGSAWNIYEDGKLVASAPSANGAISVPGYNWGAGTRGFSTSFMPEDSRASGGGLAEVAIFTNALTTAEINAIYLSAAPLPSIVSAPTVANPIYDGSTVSLSVSASGVTPISYQWYNGSGPISGQTGTTYNLGTVHIANSGTYYVVVTNPNGSVTNQVVLNVVAAPPFITQKLASTTRFTGGSATFAVSAGGSPPFTYSWTHNGSPIAGANTSSYTASGLTSGGAGTYAVTVSNVSGSTNSTATLTVVAAPTAPYPTAVLGDQPQNYYRLDEASGTVAHDYISGYDGVYATTPAVTLGVPGYGNLYGLVLDSDTAALFPGTTNGEVSGISGSGVNFSGPNVSFSLECWVNGPAGQNSGGAMIIAKGTGTEGGNGDEQFSLGVVSGVFEFYVREASDNAQVIVTSSSGPDGNWHHLVAVFDAVGGQMHLYVDGVDSSTKNAPASGPRASTHPVSIGAQRGGVDIAYDWAFKGDIDEVAIYPTALSAAQVANHYAALFGSNFKPVVLEEPTPATATSWVNQQVVFTTFGIGTSPLNYQWNLNGVPIPGANYSSYTNSAVATTDAGNYTCTISNSAGSTNTAAAVLTVLAVPTSTVPISGLVLHLPFNGNTLDTSGRGNNGTPKGTGGPTYVTDGPLGQALHYITDPSVGTNYVTLGVIPDLQFSSNVNFTIAYWVRLPYAYAGGDLPFFCTADGSTFGPGITLAPAYGSAGTQGTGSQDGGWAASFMNATGPTTGSGAGVGVYGAKYDIGDYAWHHLVHVCNRTNQLVTYLDGVVATFTVEGGNTLSAAGNIDTHLPATIGQDPTGAYGEYASADIADFGVWRRALTPLEVTGIYLAASVNQVSYANPATPLSLTITDVGGQVKLTWPTTATLVAPTLQWSATAAGPYTSLPGVSPPYSVAPSSTMKFFRLVAQ